jgi:hypothetical protein
MANNKCISVVGHFDDHGSAPEQYRGHHLMRHVQGYSRSHWKPPSGNYLLCIAQRLPGQQANKQQSTNTPTLLAISKAAVVRRYNTAHIAQWRRSRALIEATGHCHWTSIVADRCNRSCICRFFMSFFIVNS